MCPEQGASSSLPSSSGLGLPALRAQNEASRQKHPGWQGQPASCGGTGTGRRRWLRGQAQGWLYPLSCQANEGVEGRGHAPRSSQGLSQGPHLSEALPGPSQQGVSSPPASGGPSILRARLPGLPGGWCLSPLPLGPLASAWSQHPPCWPLRTQAGPSCPPGVTWMPVRWCSHLGLVAQSSQGG